MLTVSREDIQRTISQLGEGERRDTEIEIAVRRFAPDPVTLRRLIDWIPEAFGMVLLPHVGEVVLPTTFSARAKDGTWKQFSFDREPIFGLTLPIATEMYHDGRRAIFSKIAQRSSLVVIANKALNAGKSLDGAQVGGPAMLGIPAEFYEMQLKPTGKSFWKKLVG